MHKYPPAQVSMSTPSCLYKVTATSFLLHLLGQTETGKGVKVQEIATDQSMSLQCPLPAFYEPLGQKWSKIFPHSLQKQKTKADKQEH